jgi:hypothetical protein
MEIGERKIERPRPIYSAEQLGETFGVFEQIKIPVNSVCVLPQTRSKVNPIFNELTNSIEKEGLHNALDVAIMKPEDFAAHLEFVNAIWGTKVKISDYGPPNNGVYAVLIAGHTRLLSLQEIQKRRGENISFNAKIHEITSSRDFLRIQITENIHSGVNPERRAIAIVEMYYFGLTKDANPDDPDHWASQAEFARKNVDKISEDMLNDGIAFTKLPVDIRDFIFNGHVPYNLGIEIGKNSDLVFEYIKLQNKDIDGEALNQVYLRELNIIANELAEMKYKQKASGKAMSEKLRNSISSKKEFIASCNSNNSSRQITFDFGNAVNMQGEEFRRSQIELLESTIRRVLSSTSEQEYQTLANYAEISGNVSGIDLDAILQKELKSRRKIGKAILNGNFLRDI